MIIHSPALLDQISNVFQEEDLYYEPHVIRKLVAGLFVKPFPSFLLCGSPGCGKTALAETVGQLYDRCLYWQAFPGSREEDLTMKILPSENTVSGVKIFDGIILEALIRSQKETVCLILDEWEKSHPSLDSVLLDFLQNARYNSPSHKIQGKKKNLCIFVISNGERELSDPLLSRLIEIEISRPSLSIVREILHQKLSPDFKYLENLLILYQRCSHAGIIASPRELIKLGDAINNLETLNIFPDWDELVRAFVTKSKENHMLLKRVEDYEIQHEARESCHLDPQAYESNEEEEEEEEEEGEQKEVTMPSPFLKTRKIKVNVESPTLPEEEKVGEEEEVGAIINKKQLTEIVRKYPEIVELSENPSNLGGAVIQDDFIIMREGLKLKKGSHELLSEGSEYFFELPFKESSNNELFESLVGDSERIVSLAQFVIRHWNKGKIEIESISMSQIIFRSEYDNVVFSINLQSQTFEIEVNVTKYYDDETKKIFVLIEEILLDDIDCYHYFFKNFKFQEILKREEETKREKEEERKRELEEEEKKKRIKNKDGRELVTFVAAGHPKLLTKLAKMIYKGNKSDKKLLKAMIDDIRTKLTVIKSEKRITQKLKKVIRTYYDKYGFFDLSDFGFTIRTFESDYTVSNFFEDRDISITREDRVLLREVIKTSYKRYQQIKTIQSDYYYSLEAQKILREVEEEN